jgi:SAM-dependent methyltransferase
MPTAQDSLIADCACPQRLVAVNVTEWQRAAGRGRLADAGAAPVVGDAARLPIADGAADGIISVEAAFHFSSRRAFFEHCYRVIAPALRLAATRLSGFPAAPAGPGRPGHPRCIPDAGAAESGLDRGSSRCAGLARGAKLEP